MTEEPKRRTFRTFSYRGIEMDRLLDLPLDEFVRLLPARQRRKFSRGLNRKYENLVKRLVKNKKEAAYGEKPIIVNTHLRNTIVVPEMIGSFVGVYNGKQFVSIDVKPEMLGHYLGEFSLTYKPCRHGRPGVGGNNKFLPF
eukprot:GHVR01013364.1.p1 GENE.GHVR01013364.1~~GHVR01013364.1.p1  ORF type:complete len:141 (+),score=16.05 GHVR01013364.1:194-616(+)